MNWHEIFDYANGKIYWKIKPAVRVKIGDEAGSMHHTGYLNVWYKEKQYRVHVIIWEMHNGPVPKGMVIDHDDRNRANNCLSNLNLTTHAGNMKNKSKDKRNTSGVTGVRWYEKLQKWNARISIDGKLKHLGYFDTIEEAAEARERAKYLLGYHPNHGI